MAIFMEHIPGLGAFLPAAAVVLPYAFIQAVVEIEEFEVLELGGCCAEQLFAQLDERIHRTADVEEQQQLDRIAPLRAHMDIEPALLGGAFDRGVEIELVLRAFTGKAAQATQRHLDVARAQFLGAVEVLELALVPHLDRTLVSAFAADPHAFGIVARIAEGRGAAGSDPLVAALVTLFLFLEPLLQRLHDLVPVTQRLDLFHLFFGKEFLGHRLEPVFGDIDGVLPVIAQDPLEDLLENLVEPIEQALILHERRAAEVVERLGRLLDHVAIERFDQREVFLEARGNARRA